MSFTIVGTGSYLPSNIITNQDFEKKIDTSDEWIVQRTGIKTRHFTDEGEWNADMCLEAAQNAIEMAGISKEEIGGIIVGTCTNEMSCPSVACQLQRALEIDRCMAFDVNAACSGFLFALKTAERFLAEEDTYFLVLGTEVLSRFLNMEDRSTCVLFGDGAAAVVVKQGDHSKYFKVSSMPDAKYSLNVEGANREENGEQIRASISMKGNDVFAFATREIERSIKEGLEAVSMTVDDVSLFVLHQANQRIIEAVAKRLGVSMEKVVLNIADSGNISAACIPLALDQANRAGRLKSGDIIVMAGAGGGLTSGCGIIEWK